MTFGTKSAKIFLLTRIWFVVKNDVNSFFYNYVNNKLNIKNSTLTLRDIDSQITTNRATMRDIFNDFFCSVFVNDNGQLPTFDMGNSQCSLSKCYLSNIQICRLNIMESRDKMKPSYSCSPDSLPPFVINKTFIGSNWTFTVYF